MCRAGIEPQAQEAVAHLLLDIAHALADQANVDVRTVQIGPIDLGSPDDQRTTA
jgi:hypothetical protein